MQGSEIRKLGSDLIEQGLVGQCKKLDFYSKYSRSYLIILSREVLRK